MKNIYKILFLIVILLIIAVIGVHFFDFINFKCFYREIFHIWCAGCGGTRMVKSILKLDFYQAFRYNPLLFIYFIIFVIYFIYNSVLYIKEKRIIKPSTKVIIIIFIITLIYMILRNIPSFEYLRPTKIK